MTRLREALRTAGLSYAAVARALGVSKPAVVNLVVHDRFPRGREADLRAALEALLGRRGIDASEIWTEGEASGVLYFTLSRWTIPRIIHAERCGISRIIPSRWKRSREGRRRTGVAGSSRRRRRRRFPRRRTGIKPAARVTAAGAGAYVSGGAR